MLNSNNSNNNINNINNNSNNSNSNSNNSNNNSNNSNNSSNHSNQLPGVLLPPTTTFFPEVLPGGALRTLPPRLRSPRVLRGSMKRRSHNGCQPFGALRAPIIGIIIVIIIVIIVIIVMIIVIIVIIIIVIVIIIVIIVTKPLKSLLRPCLATY